ncbi:MAG: hypothetical protein ACYC9J_08145 [Sulfuricaulis sp.]
MKLLALLDETTKAVESNDSTANMHVTLAQKIADLADMVGWADGPIDSDRRLADRLESLMETLRARHARTDEPSMAVLHGALAELQVRIDRHDRDLSSQRDSDDDGEDAE